MSKIIRRSGEEASEQLALQPENELIDWYSTTIGELCSEDRIIVEPDSELARDLPYLGLENIEGVTGKIIRDPVIMNEDQGRSTTFKFDSRHILYGKLRPYLNKVALPDFEGRCTTELIPLLPQPGVSREFLAWLLRRPQTVEAAMREKTGARMPRANIKHILSLSVVIPTNLEMQTRLADEMAGRMELVSQAKSACQEQLRLLDIYAQKSLARFPSNTGIMENI